MPKKAAASNGRVPSITLTPDEAICVLSAVLCQLGQIGEVGDSEEDTQSALELREAAMKLGRGLGMDYETFINFAAVGLGSPSAETVAFFARKNEERRRAN